MLHMHYGCGFKALFMAFNTPIAFSGLWFFETWQAQLKAQTRR